MAKVISFNELRRLKDSLPDGAMQEIAKRAGPDGGPVTLDDTTIYDIAVEMIGK